MKLPDMSDTLAVELFVGKYPEALADELRGLLYAGVSASIIRATIAGYEPTEPDDEDAEDD